MLFICVVQMDDYCHSVGLLSCANRAARKHMDCLISTLGKVTLRYTVFMISFSDEQVSQ